MDFKIGDDIDENGAVEHKLLSDKTKLIIVIVVALVAGISVFLITNAIFGKKEVPVKKEPVTSTELEMTDEYVVESYKMLTYGAGGVRDNKFINGVNIESDAFSNAEKYLFALQFAVKGDFTDTGKKDENGFEIYSLPESSMDVYMNRFFGPNFSYTKEGEITNTFKFRIDQKDTGKIKYDSNSGEFLVSLSELKEKDNSKFIDDVYYYLDKATSYSDRRLELEEKVIYTKVVDNKKGSSDVYLFSDAGRTNSIGTINDVTKESANNNSNGIDDTDISALKYANLPTIFSFDDYKDKCGTIKYNLKIETNLGYYFVNSEILQ